MVNKPTLGLEEQVEKANRVLIIYCLKAEEIRIRLSYLEYESLFKEMLDNEDVSINTFFSREDIDSWDRDKKSYLEKQVENYKDLKKLYSSAFYHLDRAKRESLSSFSLDKVSAHLSLIKEMAGDFMENYSRLATFFMAYELVEKAQAREN